MVFRLLIKTLSSSPFYNKVKYLSTIYYFKRSKIRFFFEGHRDAFYVGIISQLLGDVV